MLPALVVERLPRLVGAIRRLATRPLEEDEDIILADELAGVTAMVAEKFTNDRTAEGIQRAMYLTTGCVSLGLEDILSTDSDDAALDFLIEHGAEQAFKRGYGMIKELAALPEDTLVGEYDQDTVYAQRRLKEVFFDICYADPSQNWNGPDKYQTQLTHRKEVQAIVRAAAWLRRHHYEGPISDPDLNAEGVIALAIIFAIENTGRITARTGQKEFERLVASVRKNKPDYEEGWAKLLAQLPAQHQGIIADRIANYRETCTVIQKMRGRTALKTLFTELESYAGSELEADY
ncbi:hypothetical protein [Pseudoduganella sp. GCM10020061]|uniref:hypothetical protein n=1 Tax=Pseudoduganella sp. GCM10020061 TaxID=3317345 RepID=UPI00362A8AB8